MFFSKDELILVGMIEILIQLTVLPLVMPLKKPLLQVAKFTFMGLADVPKMAYTTFVLLMVPRVLSSMICGDIRVQDKKSRWSLPDCARRSGTSFPRSCATRRPRSFLGTNFTNYAKRLKPNESQQFNPMKQ